MSEGGIRTENIFKLSWPIFLQNVTGNLVILVDFWFLSTLSDRTAAVVGQLLPVTWLGTFVVPVFASTGIAVSSQFLGAKKMEKVVPTYMANLFMTVGMGAVVAAGFWFFREDIGRWLGMDAALNAVATEFNGAISPLFICLAVMMSYNAILSSRGMTHLTMIVSLTSSSLNVLLDYWFVFGLGMGVKGVISATVISCSLATMVSIYLVHAKLGVKFYLRGLWPRVKDVIRPLLKIGVPNALEPFSYCIQGIIISGFVVSMGVVAMAANSYMGRVSMLIIAFSFSISAGGQILLGHWMGAKRFEDVNRELYKIARVSSITAGGFMLGVWLLDDWIIGLFTSDPEIAELSKRLIVIGIVLEVSRTMNIVFGGTLRALGDAKFTAIVGMAFIWGLLPVIYGLDVFWGLTIEGVWICYAADELLRGVINVWRWRTGKWKTMGVAG
ncbi:MAG: MATE family efflux transporter [Verrucomicrobiota bacterium]